ncbi:MAG: hypothetical protein IPN32_15390 [Deltaproteobacteria bacterium]|nr:hypothetical protein [Deltaproteobacteria bacterium]
MLVLHDVRHRRVRAQVRGIEGTADARELGRLEAVGREPHVMADDLDLAGTARGRERDAADRPPTEGDVVRPGALGRELPRRHRHAVDVHADACVGTARGEQDLLAHDVAAEREEPQYQARAKSLAYDQPNARGDSGGALDHVVATDTLLEAHAAGIRGAALEHRAAGVQRHRGVERQRQLAQPGRRCALAE